MTTPCFVVCFIGFNLNVEKFGIRCSAVAFIKLSVFEFLYVELQAVVAVFLALKTG
jgi:hypothetical protein